MALENMPPSSKEEILLMEEFLHQLICALSNYVQGVYIPGGAGFLPSTAGPQMVDVLLLAILVIKW